MAIKLITVSFLHWLSSKLALALPAGYVNSLNSKHFFASVSCFSLYYLPFHLECVLYSFVVNAVTFRMHLDGVL